MSLHALKPIDVSRDTSGPNRFLFFSGTKVDHLWVIKHNTTPTKKQKDIQRIWSGICPYRFGPKMPFIYPQKKERKQRVCPYTLGWNLPYTQSQKYQEKQPFFFGLTIKHRLASVFHSGESNHRYQITPYLKIKQSKSKTSKKFEMKWILLSEVPKCFELVTSERYHLHAPKKKRKRKVGH